MVLAVRAARCGVSFGGMDVYLNVAGGLRVTEPAADLAAAAALLSALEDRPAPADGVIFGEISLSGAVRAVIHGETRLKEATKLGFASALAPPAKRQESVKSDAECGITVAEIDSVDALVGRFRD